MKHVYTPVEYVLNPYDDRLWYYIPGFNGYELSNDYYIRSMKHYRKYPFGILLEPVKKADGSYDKKTLASHYLMIIMNVLLSNYQKS